MMPVAAGVQVRARRRLRDVLTTSLLAIALASCSNVSSTESPTSLETPDSSQVGDAVGPSPSTTTTQEPSEGPTSLDVCALLSPADLATVLGRPGFAAKEMPHSGWIAGQCAWSGPGGGFFITVGTSASITTSGDDSAPDAKTMLAQFRQQASAPKDIADIGDGAVLGSLGMAAYKGGTFVQVTNLGLTEDQLTAIAKLVMDRP